jgi:hypothetical protein
LLGLRFNTILLTQVLQAHSENVDDAITFYANLRQREADKQIRINRMFCGSFSFSCSDIIILQGTSSFSLL